MLDKLFSKKGKAETPKQSQTFGDVTTNGGQMSVAQAGRDLVQSQSGENAGQQQDITGTQVITLLEQLREAIEASGLTADQKEELQDYLKAAKREAGKESPDKDLIGKNLKNVGETMKNLKETAIAAITSQTAVGKTRRFTINVLPTSWPSLEIHWASFLS